jgi:hypothetical protein
VFALFWLLLVIILELIALGPLFIFFYALIGVAGAGELIPEYDYGDDFTAEDYPCQMVRSGQPTGVLILVV